MKATTLTISAFIAAATAQYGNVQVVNRCSYDVYLWSINKQPGCPSSASTLLKKNGGSWTQPMQDTKGNTDDGGVSVKLSKFSDCGGRDLSQLEYKITDSGNFLDMSFVDCQTSGDCPGFKDGFYLKSGNNGDKTLASAVDNEHCPIFGVANAAEVAKVAYVNPNDRQTKWCANSADLALYLCGAQAPGAEVIAPSSSAPISTTAIPTTTQTPSTTQTSSTTKIPTTTPTASSTSDDIAVAKAAAVTEAPKAQPPQPAKVKTIVEYVTVAVDAPVKRRHSHGRRHRH